MKYKIHPSRHTAEGSSVRIEFIDHVSSVYHFLQIHKLLSGFIQANAEISIDSMGNSVYIATTGGQRLDAVIALLEISALSPLAKKARFGLNSPDGED